MKAVTSIAIEIQEDLSYTELHEIPYEYLEFADILYSEIKDCFRFY